MYDIAMDSYTGYEELRYNYLPKMTANELELYYKMEMFINNVTLLLF